VIAGLSGLFHKNEVALRVHGDEAKAAGKGLVLGHREVFLGHVLGQACGLAWAVVDESVFHLRVAVLLSPIGGGDKAVKPRQVEEETHDAHAARADFDPGKREGNDQSVYERQSRAALKELSHRRTAIEGVVLDCIQGN
jgi:hypothetical protein